jgi:hypothetical protein
MKKIMMMMALVATALFTVTACGDDSDDNSGGNGSNGVVTLTAPPFKDVAKAFDVSDNELNIRQLRMMESGAYMIGYGAAASRTTRSVELVSYEFGKYTYNDGVFTFSNGMVITATPDGNEYKIVIQWKGGTTVETKGALDTSKAPARGVMTDNLCSKAWTVESMKAVGVFSGLRVGKEFNNAPIKLSDVKEWFENNGGKLNDEFDDSAIIEGILFDGSGLFTINYTNRLDDVGYWRWNDMNQGTLRYSWNKDVSAISIFTGEASVKFEKGAYEKCILTLMGKVNGYDLEFIFTMK